MKLPIKPSELIRLALTDLEKVEALRDTYVVDMDFYHDPDGNDDMSRCHVCFAGAVIAMSLDEDPGEYAAPGTFDDCAHQLYALNDLRMGDVGRAFRELVNAGLVNHGEIASDLHWQVAEYSSDPAKFKSDMHRMADDLEKLGY